MDDGSVWRQGEIECAMEIRAFLAGNNCGCDGLRAGPTAGTFGTPAGALRIEWACNYRLGCSFGAQNLRLDEDQVPGRDPVVVLAYDFWQNELGADESIVGRARSVSGWLLEPNGCR